MTKQALLIFAKNPEAGKVKTRLAATIGDEKALSVYRELLLRTVSATEDLPVDKFVYYSSFIERDDVWKNDYYSKHLQQGADLGERMRNAFASTFQKGYDKTVIVGTDCPDLSAGIIMNAFANLQSYDVVIGPAEDGGYYLLGMKDPHPVLFEEMKWSTNAVFSDTIAKCDSLGLHHYLLPVLNDIDEEKDLRTCKLHTQ